MRILWVEDNGQLSPELIKDWFGEFATQHDIERHYGFTDAYRNIQSQTRNYDCVILDINLENGEFNRQDFTNSDIVFPEQTENFLKEAGFHLYIQLLYKGFPVERITFLTGNASERDSSRADLINRFKQAYLDENSTAYDECTAEIAAKLPDPLDRQFDDLLNTANFDELYAWLMQWASPATILGEPAQTDTYGDLKARFYDARLTLPPPIEKGQLTATVLQNWLRQHCAATPGQREEFDYLTLRRGILDVIKGIENDSQIQFTADFQTDLDKDTFLAGLAWQVRDFALPKEDYAQSYLALCDYLSKPFERFDGRQLSGSQDLKLPLYFLRNWIAHGLITGSNTKMTAQAAAIAFLLAMQQLFGVEKYGFQNELQRLFANRITDAQKWKQLCISIGRKHGVKKVNHALDKIYRSGEKSKNPSWQQQNYIQHFYASYLLCLQQADGTVKTRR